MPQKKAKKAKLEKPKKAAKPAPKKVAAPALKKAVKPVAKKTPIAAPQNKKPAAVVATAKPATPAKTAAPAKNAAPAKVAAPAKKVTAAPVPAAKNAKVAKAVTAPAAAPAAKKAAAKAPAAVAPAKKVAAPAKAAAAIPAPKAAAKKAEPAAKVAKAPVAPSAPAAAPAKGGKKKGEVVLEMPAPKGVAMLGREGKKKGKSSESSAVSKKNRCREPGCENEILLSGFCRSHYIKNWRKIKRKEAILASGQLNNYVEELVNKYPDKYLDVIRQDLASEKDWGKVVVDLELESTDEDGSGDEDLEGVEGVRRERDFDDDSDTF